MGKGQVTLFLIVGIVLLAIATTLFFMYATDGPATTIVENTDVTLTPLQQFIEACMKETARSALLQAGIQGGYPELPQEIALNPTLYITPAGGPVFKTPYWIKQGRNYMPTIEQIEEGVAQYIEANIGFCLNDFEDFKDLQIQQISEPDATFKINENDVTIKLNYKIQYTNDIQTVNTEEFSHRYPIKLKPILDTAKAITEAHMADPFIARATIDLMSLDDKNIPLANIEFSCQQRTWYLESIKSRLQQDLLYYNLPRIRIQGTRHRPFAEPLEEYAKFADIGIENYEEKLEQGEIPQNRPGDLYEFQHYYWDVGLEEPVDIEAGLRHLPSYPMYLQARPSQNGILTSQSAQGNTEYLSFFCMNVYKFTYDMIYPVEVILVDRNAFGNTDPFVLRFALPVLIESNLPTSDVASTLAFDIADEQAFCENTFEQPVYVYVEDLQRTSDIPDVSVLYTCGKVTCNLGTTQSADNGAYARIEARLPSGCFGGEFIASAKSIMTARAQWNNQDQYVVIPTYQVVEVPTKILLGPNQALPRELEPGQVAYATLQNQEGYTVSQAFEPGTYATLRLLDKPDLYNVSITVFRGDFLVGGYSGQLQVEPHNLLQRLEFRALEDLTPPQTDEEIGEFYLSLQEQETYQGLYYPEWR